MENEGKIDEQSTGFSISVTRIKTTTGEGCDGACMNRNTGTRATLRYYVARIMDWTNLYFLVMK